MPWLAQCQQGVFCFKVDQKVNDLLTILEKARTAAAADSATSSVGGVAQSGVGSWAVVQLRRADTS
jgi:hypothetical protein